MKKQKAIYPSRGEKSWKKNNVQILEEGLKEYPEPKKLVWREGYATVRRLLRNKEHALYFLSHEGIPFHNNHAEQMARSFKRKTHQMEQFRSLEEMEIQAAISSVLQTTRMRKENIWHKAREILERQTSRLLIAVNRCVRAGLNGVVRRMKRCS